MRLTTSFRTGSPDWPGPAAHAAVMAQGARALLPRPGADVAEARTNLKRFGAKGFLCRFSFCSFLYYFMFCAQNHSKSIYYFENCIWLWCYHIVALSRRLLDVYSIYLIWCGDTQGSRRDGLILTSGLLLTTFLMSFTMQRSRWNYGGPKEWGS